MTNSFPWPLFMRQINRQKVVPIISDRVLNQFLPGYKTFIDAWAKEISYPLGTSFNITRLAQFLGVKYGNVAKSEYLYFVKVHLLKNVRQATTNNGSSIQLQEMDLDDISLVEVAARLGFPQFAQDTENPLHILANLPFPVYITTSYHTFLEEALFAAGKNPRTEICYWQDELQPASTEMNTHEYQVYLRENLTTYFNVEELKNICDTLSFSYEELPAQTRSGLAREMVSYLVNRGRLEELAAIIQQERPHLSLQKPSDVEAAGDIESEGAFRIPSVFYKESNYRPSKDNPLVYHLLGLENYPNSLVLTEDDFLNFLVKISQEKNNLIPGPVKDALTLSSLLLLGYELQDWDFRVLFKSLITSRKRQLGGVNVCIQLKPTQGQIEQAQEYIRKYFEQAKFNHIVWGSPQDFTQKLWEEWPEKNE